MRERRFIAEHRGGPLPMAIHRKLMMWGRKCALHVLNLLEGKIDKRLNDALVIAEEWANGKVKTGEAMKASVGAHAAARDLSDSVPKAIARSIGQAVAAAHMADHSVGAALYALKAVKLSGASVNKERRWQEKQLSGFPSEIQKLVLETLNKKGKAFKLFDECEKLNHAHH